MNLKYLEKEDIMSETTTTIKLYQEVDCNTLRDNTNGQELLISTESCGEGNFLVISTERWAVDLEDIDSLCEVLISFKDKI